MHERICINRLNLGILGLICNSEDDDNVKTHVVVDSDM